MNKSQACFTGVGDYKYCMSAQNALIQESNTLIKNKSEPQTDLTYHDAVRHYNDVIKLKLAENFFHVFNCSHEYIV